MKNVTVRPLLFGDIGPLGKWLTGLEFFGRYGLSEKKFTAELERALKRSDLVLVAEHKKPKSVIGFSWCQAGAAFGRSGFLRMLAVASQHQGKGVASLLLEEVEVFVADVSYDLFFLVPDFASDLQAMAEAKGYQQVGAVPGYTLPDVSELIYRKRFED